MLILLDLRSDFGASADSAGLSGETRAPRRNTLESKVLVEGTHGPLPVFLQEYESKELVRDIYATISFDGA